MQLARFDITTELAFSKPFHKRIVMIADNPIIRNCKIVRIKIIIKQKNTKSYYNPNYNQPSSSTNQNKNYSHEANE